LLVTHSSSEPESLLSESDESLQEDPAEPPPLLVLLEDPEELLELMLLGLFVVSANFSVAIGSTASHMSTSSSVISLSSSIRLGEQRPLAGIDIGEALFVGMGGTAGARLPVTHSSSELELLLLESDDSLQEDLENCRCCWRMQKNC
jgi:hypothetical protein